MFERYKGIRVNNNLFKITKEFFSNFKECQKNLIN